MQHSATYYLESIEASSHIGNLLQQLSYWNILVFVMISGYLFLSREIDAATMWKKYILRIVKCFAIWSCVYTAYNAAVSYLGGAEVAWILKNCVGDFFLGGTRRMWYLVMLIALYAFVPLISRLVHHTSEREQRYALLLMGSLAILFPSLRIIHPFETVFGLDVDRMQGVYASVYIFYLLFGYWLLSRMEAQGLTRKWNVGIAALGLVSVALVAIIIVWNNDVVSSGFVLFVPITALLALLAKSADSFLYTHKIGKMLRSVSQCSFGIYLIHTAVQYIFLHTGVQESLLRLHPLVGISGYFVLLFCVSWALIYLLRKCKWVRDIT